jgi:Dimethlysulfonioproprionate lyase
MDISGSASDSIKPRTLPTCSFLDPAIAGAKHGPTDIARVASAIKDLAPELCWRLKASGGPVFANGYANADILGSVPEALEQRDDVKIGLSLMARQLLIRITLILRSKCTLHFRAVSGGPRRVHGTNRAWAESFTIPEALPTRSVQVANHSWRSGVCRLMRQSSSNFAISNMTGTHRRTGACRGSRRWPVQQQQ